ncbi:MAG: hypothetical protein H0W30_13615 [Gemmatimonadaceae bacterium]|nr:hypothetical protein [Gemmatimonadaceae bacterium]
MALAPVTQPQGLRGDEDPYEDGDDGRSPRLRHHGQHDARRASAGGETTQSMSSDAYAKYTARLGVCIATSGPGAIHLLNGVDPWEAHERKTLWGTA